MLPRKRLLLTLAVAALAALPAAVLAGLCLGNACERVDRAQGRVPFCSLPEELRSLIAGGFRDARSPHVLTVLGQASVASLSAESGKGWPSIHDRSAPEVPLVFAGTGVSPHSRVPRATTLDTVAPTIAEIIGLRRPHPGVRSGEPIAGLASGEKPRLVVVVAWKNLFSPDLERQPQAWPVLRGLMEDGAGTLVAETGSLPGDSAAILATIGTGALPRDHGITGTFLRNDRGEVSRAWEPEAPFSVVAALGDDLDEALGQEPMIGLVASDPADRGLVGGNWYIEHDRDDVVGAKSPEAQAAAVESLLGSGYGSDPTTDLLAVAMEGRGAAAVSRLDEALGRILVAADRASSGSFALAVTSTGPGAIGSSRYPIGDVEADVELAIGADVIETVTRGGFFLDQKEMTRSGLSDDRVVSALREAKAPSGDPIFADVFPAIAVTFARYC